MLYVWYTLALPSVRLESLPQANEQLSLCSYLCAGNWLRFEYLLGITESSGLKGEYVVLEVAEEYMVSEDWTFRVNHQSACHYLRSITMV